MTRINGVSLRKMAHGSTYRQGIDLAVVIAIISAVIEAVALFLPWLAGVNASYAPGTGLTFTVTVVLSATDLVVYNPYLVLLFAPPTLTALLIVISLKPEGILPPRLAYSTKSRILLFLSAVTSIGPAAVFLQTALLGSPATPNTSQVVTTWELGGGTTIPIYAGFGFILALGLRMIKD